MQQVMTYTMRVLSFLSSVYLTVRNAWIAWTTPVLVYPIVLPERVYYLGDSRNPDEDTVVPENAVYIEEWINGPEKRNVVRYPGETIPKEWTDSPFAKNPRTPWVWVGDRETEIDLTRTFTKYLVVGNRIRPELVRKLIHVTDKTRLIYIESGTFKELDFPGDGLTIEEYVDRPVQDRGEVRPAEEAMCSTVVGGHNDSSE